MMSDERNIEDEPNGQSVFPNILLLIISMVFRFLQNATTFMNVFLI